MPDKHKDKKREHQMSYKETETISTPKMEAMWMVGRFWTVDFINFDEAKQCALICINQINKNKGMKRKFFEEMREEIKHYDCPLDR